MLRVALLLGLIFPTVSQAGQVYIGAGSDSCGSWVEARKTSGAAALQYNAWVFGYLSGLNMLSPGDFLVKPDGPAILVWMDNYCRANPLKKIINASDSLAIELGTSK